ncbi:MULTISPECIES: hypothetical protein [Flavobacterium]|uniref:hypothetical protein n=1 Tax=Flavobacterium TaxID=237 RepID=UPI001FCA9FAD|nr:MULTISPECIES: hypothetical protein [Flavobacterium]UOK43406.1 hypothetical protein LZF87_04615 [Flavobacterium enshiense]
MTSRKITFHVLKFYKNNSADLIYNDFDFEAFMKWFNKLDDKEKIFNLTETKFTSLDILEKISLRNIENHPNVYFGMMSTGNFGSRRNLKDSRSNTKRPNPKRIEEGEEQENYFLLGFKSNGDIDLIMQNAGRGIKSLNLKNYLDKFMQKYLNSKGESKEFNLVEGAVISTEDTMIARLDRVTKTKIFIDKSILGEDSLNLANRTLQAREDLIIDIRAQKGQDIRDLLSDVRQRLVYNTKIDKIWVEGKDHNGNLSQFYLNKIQKSTFVTIDIDPTTASLISDSIKRELLKLL